MFIMKFLTCLTLASPFASIGGNQSPMSVDSHPHFRCHGGLVPVGTSAVAQLVVEGDGKESSCLEPNVTGKHRYQAE